MQLGWSAGVPKKEPLRLGSSVVAGTQMMGKRLACTGIFAKIPKRGAANSREKGACILKETETRKTRHEIA